MPETTPPGRGFFSWWQRTPFYARILGGMVLGIGVGLWLGPKANALATPSELVLRLLGALAPGLILFAIMQAPMTAQFEKGTGGRLIRLLLLNTVVAILIGLLVANVVRPGRWYHDTRAEEAANREAHQPHPVSKEEAKKFDVIGQILENVPRSLLGPLGDQGRVMGVVLMAVAFGLALRRVQEARLRTLADDALNLAMQALVTVLHWVIAVIPFAVFGLVAAKVGTQGFAPFRALGGFAVAVLLALALQVGYYLVRVRLGSWVRPLPLLRGMRDALVMAFTTGSSVATMPVTYERLHQRVGLREPSAKLGALVGSNFNNDGTALYEAMAALFVSQILVVQGLAQPLTWQAQILVVLTSVIASIGAAGIPEAGLVTMTLVFSAVGLPPAYIALLLPLDWFLDRCRTVINVLGDVNVACLFDGQHPEKRAGSPVSIPQEPAPQAV